MPEIPDVELYVTKLRQLLTGQRLEKVRLVSVFVLRTVEPPVAAIEGHRVTSVSRLGKRVVVEIETGLYLVVHLMIAGRFQWKPPAAKPPGKIALALFDFSNGTLVLTEASKKRRAGVHIVRGREALANYDPGGIEPLDCTCAVFASALRKENRTLKRALTNPKTFSGIGNAYSDEILWAARLSPLRLTQALSDAETERLYEATVDTLGQWTARLQLNFADRFPGPGDVTAFRPEFAVHGRYGLPCPACGKRVQRIVYAENETNYCAQCQNEGRLLADRALSRLLRDDWPRTLEEMEGC